MRINGKDYRIPEVTFDVVCQLEDAGVSMFDIQNPQKKMLSIVRGFASIATGLEKEQTSELIQAHVKNGGNMEGWLDEIMKAVDESDFFRSITSQTQEKQTKQAE